MAALGLPRKLKGKPGRVYGILAAERRAALAAGKKRFISERRCPKCRLCERYTSNGSCCYCHALRKRDHPRKRPRPVVPKMPWELRA